MLNSKYSPTQVYCFIFSNYIVNDTSLSFSNLALFLSKATFRYYTETSVQPWCNSLRFNSIQFSLFIWHQITTNVISRHFSNTVQFKPIRVQFIVIIIQSNPSIFYTRLIRRSGRGGAGAYPSSHRARGGVHPGQVASPSQGHTETNNHTHAHTCSHMLTHAHTCSHMLTPKGNLESPVNLTCMFLDGGRKPEYLERSHAYTWRTCKLHTEKPKVGIKPGTLSL